MGVARLKKAELYYHKSVHEQIAAALQETGACQIIATTEAPQATKENEIDALISSTEEKLADVRYLSRTLTPHYVDPIPALDRMLGERPEATMTELAELAKKTDLKSICETVRAVEHETGEVRLKLSEAKLNENILSSLSFLDYPLSIFNEGTKTLTAIAGVLKPENLEALKAALGDFSPFAKDTELVIQPFNAFTPPSSIRVLLKTMSARLYRNADFQR